MRMLTKLLAATAAAGATTLLVAGPAMADPPSGTVPRVGDVVGVGSATTQFLVDQLSTDYNNQHKTAASKLYSWDAVPQGSMITSKNSANCTNTTRPTGSSQGIGSATPVPLSLEQNTTASGGTGFCTDFARSSRARVSTGSNPDPACASGGICFVGLAGDAVTWADRSAAAGGTNAPATLTATQLKNIYLCKTTNWKAVGGKAGTIQPFLPQTGSGTLTFFLTALGGGVTPITPGTCVSSDDGTGNGTNTLIENEGVAPALNSPNAIWPYSAADYDAQVQHDAQCTNGTNCGYPSSPAKCSPTSKQNKFGCDIHGVAQINPIGTSNPTKPFPAHIGACGGTTGVTCAVINQSFNKLFQRVVYDVVRFSGSTTDHIPSYLEPFFAASNTSNPGWACSNSKAKADIKSYGFAAISNTKPVHCGSVQ